MTPHSHAEAVTLSGVVTLTTEAVTLTDSSHSSLISRTNDGSLHVATKPEVTLDRKSDQPACFLAARK